MSSLIERLSEKLAQEAMEHALRTGDEKIIDEIAKSLADTSTTFQEAFLTCIRYLKADARARQLFPQFDEDEDGAIALPPPDQMKTSDADPSPEDPEAEEDIPFADAEIVEDGDDGAFSKGAARSGRGT